MVNPTLDKTLIDLQIPQYLKDAEDVNLIREIAVDDSEVPRQTRAERLPRVGHVYESQGFTAFQLWWRQTRGAQESEDTATRELVKQWRGYFNSAFICWQTLTSLPDENPLFNNDTSTVSTYGLGIFNAQLGYGLIRSDYALAFRLGVAGVLAARAAETRLELRKFDITSVSQAADWKSRVAENVLGAFALLVRKANDWDDINLALTIIDDLRQQQKDFEDTYIENQTDETDQTFAAVELVGLYHLAQLITLTGTYFRTGKPAVVSLRLQLERHNERAFEAFAASESPILAQIANLLWAGCYELIQNSIWTHIEGLGEATQQFGKLLAERANSPVIELWSSQQEAFRKRLFDQYPRAISIQMPTSAGKTLLAKFSIVQTKALNPSATIAYVVPTRALVNQITRELRHDFRPLINPSIRVEQAIPAFELDPTENRLLQNKPDVLVTTPEKLDLLIRSGHEAVERIALVIADEAHNISDGERGARLELLLGTIKRERPQARFLLLSPFLPNSDELLTWLSEDRRIPPIRVDWKPSKRVVGAVTPVGRGRQRKLYFETLYAADNVDIGGGKTFAVGSADGTKKTIKDIANATVKAFLHRGSILILCRGKGTAAQQAEEIRQFMPIIEQTPYLAAVCKYIDSELGTNSPLSECLRRGVAYHHSGVSLETRWLIEGLISRGTVKVVCGTTTLAQGMNFPISTVIINTLQKGDSEHPITYSDFWNIAGRAGRALVDQLGIVAFPVTKEADKSVRQGFLVGEAKAVASQIASLLKDIGELSEDFHFDIPTLRKHKELSPLLQFLAHAMRVSGSGNIADEVEDLLRASLVYYQLQKDDLDLSRELINLCRRYLLDLKKMSSGTLTLADQTGFATPSVISLLRARDNNSREFTDPDNWHPDHIFNPHDITPMEERIKAIADLPEIELGQGNNYEFSARLVAEIIRSWVDGETLDNLAQKYWIQSEDNSAKRISDFSYYLFGLISKVSWGIGALETVSLAGTSEDRLEKLAEESGFIPSMILFGVKKKEAIWMRMVGAPRIVSEGLGTLWQEAQMPEPGTYDDLRGWIKNLSDDEWKTAIPRSSTLTPADMRELWAEISN